METIDTGHQRKLIDEITPEEEKKLNAALARSEAECAALDKVLNEKCKADFEATKKNRDRPFDPLEMPRIFFWHFATYALGDTKNETRTLPSGLVVFTPSDLAAMGGEYRSVIRRHHEDMAEAMNAKRRAQGNVSMLIAESTDRSRSEKEQAMIRLQSALAESKDLCCKLIGQNTDLAAHNLRLQERILATMPKE